MSPDSLEPQDVFNTIGHVGFQKLVDAFYELVETDEILRPMYPKGDLEPAARRLRLFLEQYFGGPTTYSENRGHPRLRARHMRFPIDMQARDRWVELMLTALEKADLPEQVATIMRDYFENGATFLINQRPDIGGMFATPRQPQEQD